MSTSKNNSRMNAYAARALLSRIYLYHDDNEKAFQMASNLIEEVEGNGMYRLYTRDEYVPAWDLKIRLVRNHYLKLLIVQMIMEDEVHWHI